jgi:hypothetical protein
VGLVRVVAWAGGSVSFLNMGAHGDAALCGSPMEVEVKIGWRHPVEASCTGGQAQEVVVWHDDCEDEGQRWQLTVGFLGTSMGAINMGG